MTQPIHRFLCTIAVLLALLTTTAAAAQGPGSELWNDIDDGAMKSVAERHIVPSHYRPLSLDKEMLGQFLYGAPSEGRHELLDGGMVLSLPLPDGSFGRFRVVESPIMEPGLAAKFPRLKTYRGQGIDDPEATLRFDLTPAGFHAMILSPRGDVYIDPYAMGDAEHYISYRSQDLAKAGRSFECGVVGREVVSEATTVRRTGPSQALSGTTLRTYRVAVAATKPSSFGAITNLRIGSPEGTV